MERDILTRSAPESEEGEKEEYKQINSGHVSVNCCIDDDANLETAKNIFF